MREYVGCCVRSVLKTPCGCTCSVLTRFLNIMARWCMVQGLSYICTIGSIIEAGSTLACDVFILCELPLYSTHSTVWPDVWQAGCCESHTIYAAGCLTLCAICVLLQIMYGVLLIVLFSMVWLDVRYYVANGICTYNFIGMTPRVWFVFSMWTMLMNSIARWWFWYGPIWFDGTRKG